MIRLAIFSLCALALAACQTEQRQARSQTPSFYASMAQRGAVVDGAMARDMIGAYRRNNGLGPLTIDPDLQALAEAEAQAMASADKPSSTDAVKARLSSAGFAAPGANLSAGYHTLAEAFSGWRESPQHNRVLLDRSATRIGIATAYTPNSKYKVYWALVVAADRL
ncbi:CAP domain-containing protein [Microvirga sp. 2YAF29]|uniref:CAP domain-containing protein n=1 Tax=Microvirga sp. 2YAF29 TaxID=3233031 RepID=UPI003F9E6D7B